jgi:myo-inositol 2-dehydrogenase / D-chiro-inositol 1-dehydrogenase
MERRTFLKNASAVSAFTILKPATVFGSNINSAIRVGIIGVGGRGLRVISSMSQNSGVIVTAAADLFENNLAAGVKKLNSINRNNGFPEISDSNKFVGSKAFLQLLESKDIDAVLISTPAYAHPEMLEATIFAGKHVYCEKPAAIDVDGCKRIIKVSENINNNLSAVLGFQIRYATPYVEMVKRIQRGDIGDIISVQLYYFSRGVGLDLTQRMSFDEARIRNHFHFYELSGGILLDQAIHIIDVCNWALQIRPVHAIGSGGNKGSLDFGNTWTNYQVVYKYAKDVNVTVQSSQVGPSGGDVCARFIGTKGFAEAHYVGGVFIKGENEWDSGVIRSTVSLTPEQISAGGSLSSLDNANDNKTKSFIDSIKTGNYLNQLEDGCNSTLTAILGREAAINQKLVTWDEIAFSSEKINARLDLTQFDKK